MRYLISVILLIGTYPVMADYTIDQEVSYDVGGAKRTAVFKWNITEKQFRLDVTTNTETNNYVFNGKVFYTCGKLNNDQEQYFKNMKVTDPTLFTSLRKGGCHQASSDLLMRFTLSPYDAVANKVLSDDVTINLTLTNLQHKITGKSGKKADIRCAWYNRSYKIREVKSGTNYSFSESTCHAPTIKWRDRLGRELMKSLLRQPTARKMTAPLRKEFATMAGFSFDGAFKSVGVDTKGKITTQNIVFRTKKVSNTKKLGNTLVGIPSGYKIFDSRNLAALAKTKFSTESALRSNGGGDSIGSVIGFFLMGGNPIAGVIGAEGSNNKKE